MKGAPSTLELGSQEGRAGGSGAQQCWAPETVDKKQPVPTNPTGQWWQEVKMEQAPFQNQMCSKCRKSTKTDVLGRAEKHRLNLNKKKTDNTYYQYRHLMEK